MLITTVSTAQYGQKIDQSMYMYCTVDIDWPHSSNYWCDVNHKNNNYPIVKPVTAKH